MPPFDLKKEPSGRYLSFAEREWGAHEAEARRLRHRPRDDEMARWLDHDKDRIKLDDAIASVEIEEPTTRPHGRRQIATEQGGGPAGRLPRPILRQSLTLTLLNGTPITIETSTTYLTSTEKTVTL